MPTISIDLDACRASGQKFAGARRAATQAAMDCFWTDDLQEARAACERSCERSFYCDRDPQLDRLFNVYIGGCTARDLAVARDLGWFADRNQELDDFRKAHPIRWFLYSGWRDGWWPVRGHLVHAFLAQWQDKRDWQQAHVRDAVQESGRASQVYVAALREAQARWGEEWREHLKSRAMIIDDLEKVTSERRQMEFQFGALRREIWDAIVEIPSLHALRGRQAKEISDEDLATINAVASAILDALDDDGDDGRGKMRVQFRRMD